MSQFLNGKYQHLKPYVPGEQPKDAVLLKLNTNESPFPPSPRVKEALLGGEIDQLRLYSDPSGWGLREAIAGRCGLTPEQVTLGNGSDEILAFAFLGFLERVQMPDISYGFYPIYAELFGCKTTVVPLGEDFKLNLADYDDTTPILFANPNAPTGLAVSVAEIEAKLMANPNRLVIVDEAYADFWTDSCVRLIARHKNLLVVQTFSKSRCLAGMRIGMAMGDADLICDIEKIRNSINPYNLDRLALLAGQAAIEDEAYFIRTRNEVIWQRDRLTGALEALGFAVLPSQTNFLFVKHSLMTGGQMEGALRKKGILTRYFNTPRLADYLRITVGTAEQMDVLVEKIAEILLEVGK